MVHVYRCDHGIASNMPCRACDKRDEQEGKSSRPHLGDPSSWRKS